MLALNQKQAGHSAHQVVLIQFNAIQLNLICKAPNHVMMIVMGALKEKVIIVTTDPGVNWYKEQRK